MTRRTGTQNTIAHRYDEEGRDPLRCHGENIGIGGALGLVPADDTSYYCKKKPSVCDPAVERAPHTGVRNEKDPKR
jgi:hypothetical protein